MRADLKSCDDRRGKGESSVFMGGMRMQFVKSAALYVSCVAGAVSFSESAATPHMTKASPAEVLLAHDTIMRS
jgi:hypothetical protein